MVVIDLEQAKLDPASVFARPSDVLENKLLSRQDKIDILKRWAYDEREIAVAEEENMLHFGTQQKILLEEIMKALLILDVNTDQDSPPPTKQG